MSNKPKILIADSNLAVQAQLGKILGADSNVISLLKYEQLTFWSKEKAHEVDFIFVCESFIGGDINQFCRDWKNDFKTRNCKIVVLGDDSDEQEILALKSGAVLYLRKPLNFELCKYRLAQLIAQQQNMLSLEKQSYFDALTGLANRHYMNHFLQAEWGRAQREHSPVGMIIVDIDQFKLYNDQYGHIQGDNCLKTVAKALKSSAKRPRDMVARFGGEEFILILPNIQAEGMAVVARKIRENICLCSIPHASNAQRPLITVSMGLAWSETVNNNKAENLIIAADKGLYEVKNTGRDGYSKLADISNSKSSLSI